MAKKDKSLTREQQKEVKRKEKALNKAKKALQRAKKPNPSPTTSTTPTHTEKEAKVKKEPTRGRPLSAHEQASRTALKTDGKKTTISHQGTTKEGQKVRVVTVTTKMKTIPKKKGKK